MNQELLLQLEGKDYFKSLGKVVKVVGLTIESVGPEAKLKDICEIIVAGSDTRIKAEVVGFKDKRLLLMPFENIEGVGVGCMVENTGRPLQVQVGETLLGHIVDGLGRPTDIKDGDSLEGLVSYPAEANCPDPMKREIIKEALPLGVKAVDGLITVGKGQRIGIFAGSGVADMMKENRL